MNSRTFTPSGTARRSAARRRRYPWMPRSAAGKALWFFLAAVLAAMLLGIGYFLLFYKLAVVGSGSMEPTLDGEYGEGDRLLCLKTGYSEEFPKRWDIVLFTFPKNTGILLNVPGIPLDDLSGKEFVKRTVGLPGESLAIARGDIWTRKSGSDGPYRRQVKSDQAQGEMWINAYYEDFSDIGTNEFLFNWRAGDGEGSAEVTREKTFRLSPGEGGLRLDYRPMIRTGSDGLSMTQLAGVPDRYFLPQMVRFACRNILPGGGVCGATFEKYERFQNVQARCPSCGTLAREDSVVYYGRRTGLAAIGPDAVSPRAIPAEEYGMFRMNGYHFVPDLRIVADIRLADAGSRCAFIIDDDSDSATAWLAADGGVRIERSDGAAAGGGGRGSGVGQLSPGGWCTVEFYVADGTARLFVGTDRKTALECAPAREARRPGVKVLPERTGVSIQAYGGVELRNIRIDRDVFYYTGLEMDYGEYYQGMGDNGEIEVGAKLFFPLGDNCTSSLDARAWGPMPLSQVSGRPLMIIWPPDRRRSLEIDRKR